MFLMLALYMQVQVRVSVPVPVVRFEVAPAMVEVQPGVLVVNDADDEVFFVEGRYWMHARDGRWYRANDHRGGWVVAEDRSVPRRIGRFRPGQYRHHKGRPEKLRVAHADGTVTEYKVKQKHGMTVVKVKEKRRGNGKGRR